MNIHVNTQPLNMTNLPSVLHVCTPTMESNFSFVSPGTSTLQNLQPVSNSIQLQWRPATQYIKDNNDSCTNNNINLDLTDNSQGAPSGDIVEEHVDPTVSADSLFDSAMELLCSTSPSAKTNNIIRKYSDVRTNEEYQRSTSLTDSVTAFENSSSSIWTCQYFLAPEDGFQPNINNPHFYLPEERLEIRRNLFNLTFYAMISTPTPSLLDTLTNFLVRFCDLSRWWQCCEVWLPQSFIPNGHPYNPFFNANAPFQESTLHLAWSHINGKSNPKQKKALKNFLSASNKVTFQRGVGAVGRVWNSECYEWVRPITDITKFQRADLAFRSGLQSGLFIPLCIYNRGVGVISFYRSGENGVKDSEGVALLSQISSIVGSAWTAFECWQRDVQSEQLQGQASSHN